jgi:hypothetical protein
MVRQLVDLHVIENVVPLLSSPDPRTVEEAVWTIGNIAGDHETFRDKLLEEGALSLLVDVIDLNQAILKVGIWAISNLCRKKPPFEKVRNLFSRFYLLHRSSLLGFTSTHTKITFYHLWSYLCNPLTLFYRCK